MKLTPRSSRSPSLGRAAARAGVLAALALAPAACAAKYQTIHRDPASAATGAAPKGADDHPAAAPTAGVEVLTSGQVVAQVVVGQPFTISPTPGTQAAGGTSDQSCVNPGIVAAHYRVSDAAVLDAKRANDCAALSVPHTIGVAGSYKIDLEVTSDTGITAQASMTLLVTDATGAGVPGFVCTATPQLTTPATPVTFVGDCQGGSTSWDFGDGASGQGSPATHAYATPGQYYVAASCARPSGPESASVTVTVVPSGPKPDGVTPTSTLPDGVTPGGATGNGTTAGGSGYGTTAGGSGNGTTAGGSGNGTTAGGSGNGTTAGGSGNGTTAGGSGYGTTAGGSGNGTTAGGTGKGSTGGGTGKGSPGQTPVQTPGQAPLSGKH